MTLVRNALALAALILPVILSLPGFADDLKPEEVAARCENNKARLAELRRQSDALPLMPQYQATHIADDMIALGSLATHEERGPEDVKLVRDLAVRYGYSLLSCVNIPEEQCGLQLIEWMRSKDIENAANRTQQQSLLEQMHAHETNIVALGCDAVRTEVSGEWNSNWGKMHLDGSAMVDGTYDYQEGRVYGQMDGNVLTGKWSQKQAGQKCKTAELGSFYWGRIKFVFSADGKNFSGDWGYCDAEVGGGDWTGNKIN